MLERFADARVLVVDDSTVNVALLEAVLIRAGLRAVETETDPRQALIRLREADYDLVLLDLHMPHLDGYAILRHIRADAAGRYLPVLVLTGDTRPEALRRALGDGARDFLTRPFDAEEVVLRARNLLETRYLHSRMRRHNGLLREQLSGYQDAERAEAEASRSKRDRIERILSEQRLTCVFQPVVHLPSRSITGVEALARFPIEPARGPDRWFTEAAEVGLAVPLELLAVETALRALKDLPQTVFLAVNVSPPTVLSPELAEMLTGPRCRRLVLELTEHVQVEDYDALTAALELPRARGVRLAVDDTGAGFASLQHLLGLAPDVVKLDISLTRGIDRDAARRALAGALVLFTAEIGAILIAEGVETASELQALEQLGVQYAQGYHLGRPSPLPDALAGVAQRNVPSPVAALPHPRSPASPPALHGADARVQPGC
jgi:EAL domain-containing protein (putative c-di-GMP-specific phosphodiesterase class I)/AmiR/NasT family two-component response regulator